MTVSQETEIPKPDELLAIHSVAERLFVLLKKWFGVPDSVVLDLVDIDCVTREMSDPAMIAALTMRKLQALRLVARPGIRTTTDVVVSIVQDLERALFEASKNRIVATSASPNRIEEAMRILDGDSFVDDARQHSMPVHLTADDGEIAEFILLHRRIQSAARSVLDVSDNQIRILV